MSRSRVLSVLRWALLVVGALFLLSSGWMSPVGALFLVAFVSWAVVLGRRNKKKAQVYAKLIRTDGSKPEFLGPFKNRADFMLWYKTNSNWEGVERVDLVQG